MEQLQNARFGIEGLWVRASPEALHCGLRRPVDKSFIYLRACLTSTQPPKTGRKSKLTINEFIAFREFLFNFPLIFYKISKSCV